MNYWPSRLQRKESARNLRQAIFFAVLSIFLLIGLVFLGIPVLAKMAIFISDLKNTTTPVETRQTLPPSPPHLKSLPEATNSAQIKVTGNAQPGNTIKLFLSEIFQGDVVAENNSAFEFNHVNLTQGVNELFVKAVDQNGGESQPSNHLRI